MLLADIDISKKHADFTYRVMYGYQKTITEQYIYIYFILFYFIYYIIYYNSLLYFYIIIFIIYIVIIYYSVNICLNLIDMKFGGGGGAGR
jgi:hypothetical protein